MLRFSEQLIEFCYYLSFTHVSINLRVVNTKELEEILGLVHSPIVVLKVLGVSVTENDSDSLSCYCGSIRDLYFQVISHFLILNIIY